MKCFIKKNKKKIYILKYKKTTKNFYYINYIKFTKFFKLGFIFSKQSLSLLFLYLKKIITINF